MIEEKQTFGTIPAFAFHLESSNIFTDKGSEIAYCCGWSGSVALCCYYTAWYALWCKYLNRLQS